MCRFDASNTPTYSVSFPLHFRYQMPSNELDYNEIHIYPPLSFLKCPQLNGTESLWFVLNYGDYRDYILKAKIPTGQLWMKPFITTTTFIVTLFGAAVIVVTLLRLSN
jgi:hypothetical protein